MRKRRSPGSLNNVPKPQTQPAQPTRALPQPAAALSGMQPPSLPPSLRALATNEPRSPRARRPRSSPAAAAALRGPAARSRRGRARAPSPRGKVPAPGSARRPQPAKPRGETAGPGPPRSARPSPLGPAPRTHLEGRGCWGRPGPARPTSAAREEEAAAAEGHLLARRRDGKGGGKEGEREGAAWLLKPAERLAVSGPGRHCCNRRAPVRRGGPGFSAREAVAPRARGRSGSHPAHAPTHSIIALVCGHGRSVPRTRDPLQSPRASRRERAAGRDRPGLPPFAPRQRLA